MCDDPALLHHLFVTYDMRWEVKLSAVQKITETFSGITSAALADKPEMPEEDVVANVSALYQAQSSSEGAPQPHSPETFVNSVNTVAFVTEARIDLLPGKHLLA